MGYSTGKFSEIGSFFKMAVTQKIEVGISSNFLQSISTSCVSENVIKILSDFEVIFWKKPWAIVQGNFQKLAHFLKWP